MYNALLHYGLVMMNNKISLNFTISKQKGCATERKYTSNLI